MAKSKSAKKVLDSYTVKGTHKVVKGEFAPLVFETWKVFLGEDFEQGILVFFLALVRVIYFLFL